MTPRTLAESYQHDLDMPDSLNAVRNYYRGYHSGMWYQQDRSMVRTVIVVAVIVLCSLFGIR